MKTIEDKYFVALMRNTVTRDRFLKLIGVKMKNLPVEVYEMLEYSISEQSSENAEIAIYLIFEYEINLDMFVGILNSLIICDWHEQHENIAMLLQKAHNPSSVSYLYKAMNDKHEYIDWDFNYAFAVKCIWALGDIGNDEAKEKLEILLQSDNEIIQRNAKEQLGRIVARKKA